MGRGGKGQGGEGGAGALGQGPLTSPGRGEAGDSAVTHFPGRCRRNNPLQL